MRTLEQDLIEYCAPTLASIKTGSLFSRRCADLPVMRLSLLLYNECLQDKGVTILELQHTNGRMLIYVCRLARLQQDLQQPGVADFLRQLGYVRTDTSYAIGKLRQRLETSPAFPHEIGLFLGYPLADVQGFIANAGTNCKCCGCWKVYGNEREAAKRFAQFKKCSAVYRRLWSAGTRTLLQLTVAA